MRNRPPPSGDVPSSKYVLLVIDQIQTSRLAHNHKTPAQPYTFYFGVYLCVNVESYFWSKNVVFFSIIICNTRLPLIKNHCGTFLKDFGTKKYFSRVYKFSLLDLIRHGPYFFPHQNTARGISRSHSHTSHALAHEQGTRGFVPDPWLGPRAPHPMLESPAGCQPATSRPPFPLVSAPSIDLRLRRGFYKGSINVGLASSLCGLPPAFVFFAEG